MATSEGESFDDEFELDEGEHRPVDGTVAGVELQMESDESGDSLLYLFEEFNEVLLSGPGNRVQRGRLLARFRRSSDVLETYPLRSYPDEADFLEPKHGALKCIVFEGFRFEVPGSEGEAEQNFFDLPAGFVKSYQHGLGMNRKCAAIVQAATTIPDVETLILQRGYLSPPRVEGSRLILSEGWFDATRRALERITVNQRREALIEKRLLVHNQMLHAIDARRFPMRPPPYRRDVVYRVVQASAAAGLSTKDQSAAIELVAKNKEAIAAAQPKQVMRLRSELELVTLSTMIEKFKAMLGQPSTEQTWQTFFGDNAFVLSMAFGYPVVQIGEQVTAGGTRLSGAGTKYTDFAARHASTGNLAIVEIKRPTTDLLAKKEYRSGVYPMSPELTGGVQQVLDQRYHLQRSLPLLKDSARMRDLQGYAIDCVLIAGSLSQLLDESMFKSFEIARRAVHGVLIVTFDELLAKLDALRDVLGEGLADTP